MIVLALQLFSLSLHTTSAFGDDFLAPGFSPALDEMCKHVECGQGTCKSSINETFGYICECDQGWSRYAGNLSYMPCVVPNCTLNYSCSNTAEPPSSVPEPHYNHSIFDPCSWSYCGHGTCVKNSTFDYMCDCKPGYANLVNISYFPCFEECSVEGDCASHGIGLSNSKASSNPPSSSAQSNSAHSIHSLKLGLAEKQSWLIVLIASFAMVLY
ncbi:hypothetical protein QJS10_CPB15g01853 [Acorus calamus]|uniref:EGF-like domain-containing protein n=1 Tax=Acorus calamus TaxID=4465 RepID=A0AAV9DAK4_ACOCL|nr:hypothetical protein QJS10_CPB15g01853 [Acorus calamus]